MKNKTLKTKLLLPLLCTAAAIAMFLLDLEMLALVPWMCLYIRSGKIPTLISGIVGLVLLVPCLAQPLYGYDMALEMVLPWCAYFVLGSIAGAMLKSQKPYRSTLMLLATGIAAMMLAEVIAPSLGAGEYAFAGVQANLDQTAALMGLPAASIPDAEIFVAYAIFSGMLFGGIALVITHAFNKKLLKPMAKFSYWQLSREYTKALWLWIAVSVIILLADIQNTTAILAALTVLFATPLAVQGFCFLWCLSNLGCSWVFSKPGIIITLVLFFPYSIFIHIIAGIYEQKARSRGKLDKIKPFISKK